MVTRAYCLVGAVSVLHVKGAWALAAQRAVYVAVLKSSLRKVTMVNFMLCVYTQFFFFFK